MMLSLKELMIILVIATVIFRLARPLVLIFTTKEDFARRTRAWYLLTAAAFLSPNFWLFALIATPVLIWVGRKDSNPGAVYLFLLQVIPSIPIMIPMPGISRLFDIDNYLLVSIFVLIPAALRLVRSKERGGIRRLELMDVLLLSYGVLTAFLYLHPETSPGELSPFTFTDGLRRAFVFFIGVYIPYFVISRSVSSRRVVAEDMAALCLACGVMAAVALFESAKQWLLYAELAGRWGQHATFTMYYKRGDALRAMASAGHPLGLGYLLAIAFGFWLYLKSAVKSARTRVTVTVFWCLGLLVSYSRGPWVGAVCIYFVYAALTPRALPRLFKAAGVTLMAAIGIALSPLGDRVMNALPGFTQSTDDQSVVYRRRLFARAWDIIQGSPFFGDQDALLKMQDLRQGEGIIDIINGYVNVLLDNGFVGLALIIGFILIGLLKSFVVTRRVMSGDQDLGMLGASLAACIVATLVMLENGGFGGSTEKLFYVLAGLTAGYAYLGQSWKLDSPIAAQGARLKDAARNRRLSKSAPTA
jgi:O-antigen ligase